MLGRMPYSMPCKHVACYDCIYQKVVVEGDEFVCPFEGAFVNNMSEPVYNKELFCKVKTRERELTVQHWEREKKRDQ